MSEWELMIQAEMHDNGLIGYDWLGNLQISKWHRKQIATNRTNCQLNATYVLSFATVSQRHQSNEIERVSPIEITDEMFTHIPQPALLLKIPSDMPSMAVGNTYRLSNKHRQFNAN